MIDKQMQSNYIKIVGKIHSEWSSAMKFSEKNFEYL